MDMICLSKGLLDIYADAHRLVVAVFFDQRSSFAVESLKRFRTQIAENKRLLNVISVPHPLIQDKKE